MDRFETGCGDSVNASLDRGGGLIPDSDGVPAFTLRKRRPMPLPILVAVPHAGRHYTADLTARLRHPREAALRLEDRYVDLIAERVAKETGAALLLARAPRAMIDLNRSPDDVDWQMVHGGKPGTRSRMAAGRRARSGLGLVPRRLPGLGELWSEQMSRADLDQRIEMVHQPYHVALAKTLEGMRDRWGAALLIDMHSMPPLGVKSGPDAAADFVIGDRFGAACTARLIAASFDHLEASGAVSAHNRPYAGGYVLDRHGAPFRRISAMQLEICRAAYLDPKLREPGDGLDRIAGIVTGMVRRLADELAGQAGDFLQAAE
ncbi:N-formylglutamate amidohydrolase [Aurantiacibacter aquimixticola]|uniref:N-formylglutamate amidohydrolase n=1 Tax=Aurantiacibacter aquimixticola TaxID=1958945 RepID=A0A419RST7_9SPHN|nr:N-formylglutamate amidohydrolase [Aurantiacibacter aquimixticola]RJY08847.1 N-formylglutamate amidohydrolase [Aurantiacibacter aquimixticola]